MNVLVDTPVWSAALRRRTLSGNDLVASELASLVTDGRVAIIGAIRQEILSGVRERSHYERLRDHLRAFPDIVLTANDYEQAAEFFNMCRARGVQGSNTDFLICAVAVRRDLEIFTTDGDFEHYRNAIPITLHDHRR